MKLIKDNTVLKEEINKFGVKNLFSDFQKVSESLSLVYFPKNTFIYSLEEHNKYAYFMVKGRISLHANSINGKNQLIRICEAPVFIGDMEIMGYHEESNTIRTTQESTFIAFPLEILSEIIKKDVKFANYICRTMAEKIYYFSSQQMTNKMNTAYENVASYLIDFSDEKGYFFENLSVVSEILGISYRHLLRVLKKLSEKNLIRKKNRGYQIIDVATLKKLSEGNLTVIRY